MSLIKIALATTIIAIALLIVLSQFLEPKIIDISKIDGKMVGENVKVSGTVSQIKQFKTTSFAIKDNSGEIYGFSYELLNLTKGDYEIIGTVNEYRGVLEIEISKMRIIK